MAHVVTENCMQCKFTSCVDTCPVLAFHVGENYLVINPEECIDCGMCALECEANAVYAESDLPYQYEKFVKLNKQLSKTLPVILASKAGLLDISVPRHKFAWAQHQLL